MSSIQQALLGYGASIPSGPWRYFRMTVTKWVNGSSNSTTTPKPGQVRIGEWELYTVADVKHPPSNMTSNSAPSPLVASASSVQGAGFEVYRAFDGTSDNSHRYMSSSTTGVDVWLQIDLGSGNGITPTYFKIAADENVFTPSFNYIIDFYIDGSNTGSFSGEQDRLLTRSGLGDSNWRPPSGALFRFDRP